MTVRKGILPADPDVRIPPRFARYYLGDFDKPQNTKEMQLLKP